MMSHDTNYGYKKIFRLKGRQTGQKRSLEARADAFSRLKNPFANVYFCAVDFKV